MEKQNNYALPCGELRSPPVLATLSRMLTISEVEPTHVSTLVTFCVRPTDLTLSCAARAACRSLSGAAVAANDVRRTGWRPATGVTPSAGDEVGSSAAGPKPGRISFTPKLGRGGPMVGVSRVCTLADHTVVVHGTAISSELGRQTAEVANARPRRLVAIAVGSRKVSAQGRRWE